MRQLSLWAVVGFTPGEESGAENVDEDEVDEAVSPYGGNATEGGSGIAGQPEQPKSSLVPAVLEERGRDTRGEQEDERSAGATGPTEAQADV